MVTEPKPEPSFSPWRKWSIGLNVTLIIVVVFSVVVMGNYLSSHYFGRYNWSTRTKVELSPLTLKFLDSLTNRVKVTLYYDVDEPFYATVTALLNEYRLANPRITVENVDYLRDAGAAQKVKAQYKLTLPTATNLVIFDCEGKVMSVDGNALTRYVLEPVPEEKQPTFRRKPVEFAGEKMFTQALLNVTNLKPLNALFLVGHGEHMIDNETDVDGYLKFASIVNQNYVRAGNFSFQGTNGLPADCHLLVIAGPKVPIPDDELEKIEKYLDQGGRLLAMFNWRRAGGKTTGLEKILAKWGVEVGQGIVKDPENSRGGHDIIVSEFGKHPLVNPLLDLTIHVVDPEVVSKIRNGTQTADAANVEEMVFTGPHAFLEGQPRQQGRFPLAAAVEKGAIKGVITERGSTRMVVLGDSLFLGNQMIESAANRDFAGYAINWLLNRTQLLEAIGPRQLLEYRLVMTQSQLERAQWLLLAGMPGAVLLLGGLVWLRRRR